MDKALSLEEFENIQKVNNSLFEQNKRLRITIQEQNLFIENLEKIILDFADSHKHL